MMFFLAGSTLMAGAVCPSVGSPEGSSCLEHRALSVSHFFFLWKVGEGPLMGSSSAVFWVLN